MPTSSAMSARLVPEKPRSAKRWRATTRIVSRVLGAAVVTRQAYARADGPDAEWTRTQFALSARECQHG